MNSNVRAVYHESEHVSEVKEGVPHVGAILKRYKLFYHGLNAPQLVGTFRSSLLPASAVAVKLCSSPPLESLQCPRFRERFDEFLAHPSYRLLHVIVRGVASGA